MATEQVGVQFKQYTVPGTFLVRIIMQQMLPLHELIFDIHEYSTAQDAQVQLSARCKGAQETLQEEKKARAVVAHGRETSNGNFMENSRPWAQLRPCPSPRSILFLLCQCFVIRLSPIFPPKYARNG